MSHAAVIFPGQGSQIVGMGRDVAEAVPRAREVFDHANRVLGFDIAQTCFEGPAERLEQTDIQQPAIFVTSVALWEAFLDAGGSRDAFACTGGLSLGEYTALYVAGAMGFAEGLRLVRKRGELMQKAAEAAPGGMVSLRADEELAKSVCDRARGDDVLAPANFNCPGQVVISGSKSACDRAMEVAGDAECRAIALPVAGAFHSSLMISAAEGLWPALMNTPFTNPEIPVIANLDAEPHQGDDAIRTALRGQVTRPVLWQKSIERMIAAGITRFVEIGPGRVLTGMMRKIDREMTAINVSKLESIPKAVEALGEAE